MKGINLAPAVVDIADGGGDLEITLPRRGVLTNVSVHPYLVTCPPTFVRLLVYNLANSDRSIHLGDGMAYCVGTTVHSFTWHGNFPLDPDYEWRLKAAVFNFQGAVQNWVMTGQVQEDED